MCQKDRTYCRYNTLTAELKLYSLWLCFAVNSTNEALVNRFRPGVPRLPHSDPPVQELAPEKQGHVPHEGPQRAL